MIIKCSVPDCPRDAATKGYCPMHYARLKRHGDPLAISRKPPSNYQPKTCSVAGCPRSATARGFCDSHARAERNHGDPTIRLRAKHGSGTIDRDGYHILNVNGRPTRLHRIIWEAEHGPIPPGFHIHHINGDKLDNQLENLQALSAADHMRLTHTGLKRRTRSDKGKKRGPYHKRVTIP